MGQKMSRSAPPSSSPPSSDPAITYRQQYRRCGKKSCSRCAPGQPGHGPYWYASWWENGRQRTSYVGKDLPADVDAIPASTSPDMLRVQTLGGFAVLRDGTALAWTSRRAAALFKCLLSAPRHRLSREQAMELLWPEADPDLAAANLRSTIHILRRTLDAPGGDTHVLTEGEMLVLKPAGPGSDPADWLDAKTFERLATEAVAGRDVVTCRRALERYAGGYLPDDPYETWSEPTRGRLQRLRTDLLLHLAQLSAGQGELDEAEEALRTVLESDAGHEDAAGALMSLLAASGRGSEALRVYQALASALEEDLDVAPGAEIETLRARIIAQRTSKPAAHVSPSGGPPGKTNLPAPVTSFVGRDWELNEVTDLLSRSRMVTLTGPGGCGKTRLAVESAARLIERFADGVWMVELAGLADAALVPSVVASVLGVEEQPGISLTDTLCAAWQASETVLLLDNCEHLIGACAVLAAVLLGGCPSLRILATSREPLRVEGEMTHHLPSLAAPDPARPPPPDILKEYEAVALFLDRARARRPDFALTDANVFSVAQICARLDGLPLAIELAAGRLSVLPVEVIAERLDDRFRLLAGGPRTALPRQQTLRATVDWSYSLLEQAEQLLLRRLAVFAGGFTLEAVESVCSGNHQETGDVLDQLDGLVHKSLVAREEKDGESRYRMLETIRQYAREKLNQSGEESTLLDRHASYFAVLGEQARGELVGPEQLAWLRRLQADLDNIRAALRWSQQSGQTELGLRLVAPIWRFWMVSGQSSEGRRWLTGLLGVESRHVATAVRAEALHAAGSLAYLQSDPAGATDLYVHALELRRALGDVKGMAETLNGLGVASMDLGDYRRAQSYLEESVALRTEVGDTFGTHAPLANLASIAKYHGEYAHATELYERALAIQRQFGHIHGILISLDNLAQLWGERGEYGRAAELNQEALSLARERGLVAIVAKSLETRGARALEQGYLDEAEADIIECLELCRSVGDRVQENTVLINLAEVVLARGDLDRAALLAEEALSALRQIRHQRGQAFALMTLSDVARKRGEHERAAALLEECLELRREMGDASGTIVTMEGRARLALSRGRLEEAARLYGEAAARRAELGTPLAPYWQEAYVRDIEQLREGLGTEVFERLWGEAVSS
jgi:predicted ATPase/DNA-binding SARP family transcriptional activator